LRRCPLAVVRRNHDVLAFANLWQGADREELSIDLMRYVATAPPGIMDFLFAELMLWGRAEGYRWFNLGMAPLSGLEARPLGPLVERFGAWLYRHGEAFYNFQGLREYKQKFSPVWTARYLVSPGGLALPRILADLAALVSGGARATLAGGGRVAREGAPDARRAVARGWWRRPRLRRA
jgi:phosphatidylglycerol lysyltransferase